VLSPGVLIVDDVADTRELLAELLGSEGYRAVGAADVTSAFTLMERELPALIITDLMMPGTDGAEFLLRLAAVPRLRAIPVLLLSAAGADDVRARLRAAAEGRAPSGEGGQADPPGVPVQLAGIMQKPFSIPVLLEAVKSAIALPA
jgi:CheY-like chemotaxis protein